MPYRIETPRLVLRCWEPSDAAGMLEAITASLDHLRPWMPWAHTEPQTLEQTIDKIRGWRVQFDRGANFFFALRERGQSRIIGGIGTHRRIGAGALEIGYWIRADSVNRGYMTEAAGALTRACFEVGGARLVEIHCDPVNVASAAIPRKLGFRHVLTMTGCVPNPTLGPRSTSVWAMDDAAFWETAIPPLQMAAFDAAGRPLAAASMLKPSNA